MAYDEGLAQRIRDVLADLEPPRLVEKKMFGGVAFMAQGNLACGVSKDELIVRVGPAAYPEAVDRPYARPFDMTGRPMKGWVLVAAEGCQADDNLRAWVQQGVDFCLVAATEVVMSKGDHIVPPSHSKVYAGRYPVLH
ncbi:MAG: TfoX/Sxy family protein [Anaerolineae bacterium]